MPVKIDTADLEQIFRAAAVIHTETECRVAIETDAMRLRSFREDKTIYFEHALPYSEVRTPHTGATGSFWIELAPLVWFLWWIPDETVQLTFPFESPDSSSLVIKSNGLTYRAPSLIRQYGHHLPDVPASEPVSTCSIRHGAFARAVKAANHVGGEMQLRTAPDTRDVEFVAEGADGSSCQYVVPADDIQAMHGSTATLRISIETLREFTPVITDSNQLTLSLFENHLQYTVAHPPSDATLRLYIAERASTVPG